MMKKFLPKKIRAVVWIILLIGAVVGFIGVFSEIKALMIAGVITMLCAIIVHFTFYKCPHCGRFLDRSTGEYCPYCGKEINK